MTRPDELRIKRRLTIFEEHPNNFLQIVIQFVQRLTLTVSSRETMHVTYV
jgi:hypothetical protein